MYAKNTDVRKHEGAARTNYSDPLTVQATVFSCSCMITRLALCFGWPGLPMTVVLTGLFGYS